MSADDLATPQQVLECPMQGNDAGATTIREYLVALLAAVWHEGEGFSGKRPFGNSGWEYEVYSALGRAGLIRCVIDADGYVDDCDDTAGNRLVAAAIQSLGQHP